ncbi:endonuclease domain-containing protein [Mesorhizobium sp. SP-1A]|uniref:endonuclease domain-containing protein n=1 Tax=Mesorhizobium sp. SP-1A TaxID=3077840 RepID=UPI0028F6D1F9|nr:DUF559 domain-containing protein [Mesorhizobium sp. SP-1A]
MSRRSRDGEGGCPAGTRRKPEATTFARTLRKNGTKSEALLWMQLKANRLGGYHFVRQLPVGTYIADFAVELNGSQHADSVHDRHRDTFLQKRGWSILRFWNEDVLRRRTAVCNTILAALEGRLSENVAMAELRFAYSGLKSVEEI